MIRAARELDPRALRALRLGVLGGSFDPPHAGHLHLLRLGRSARGLDHVVFVPAGRPPHKEARPLAPAAKRLRALELLLEDEPDVSIWTVELERDGPSYTVDTLRALRARLGPEARLFLLLGEDNVRGFPAWREAEAVLELAEPVLAPRREARGEAQEPPSAGLSARARARLAHGRLEGAVVDASSTEIRARLARGEDPGASLPERLREYLSLERLYGAG